MSAFRLALRRSLAQSGLLLTILGVTVVVSGVLVGLAGYLDLAVASAARGVISNAEPADAAARLEIKANDPDAQAAAMDALLEPRFADTSASIDRAVAIYPLPVIHASDGSFPHEEAVAELPGLTIPGEDAEARLHVLADPSLPERAVLDAGEWPGAGGAAIHSKAAELFGIGVGDLLLVGPEGKAKTLVVSGLWSPLDSGEAYWMGDPGIATGEGFPAGDGTRSFGPLVVDEPTLLSLDITPTAWWTIVPTVDTITPAQWERLDRALTGLRDEVRALPDSLGAASVISGGLASTTSDVLTGLGAIRGVTPVGLVLVGVLGVVTLVQLARLLGLARRPETALLRSRGASAQRLTTVSGIESLIVAATGAGLGLVAASALLHALFGDEAGTVLPWHYAAGVAAAVVGVLGLIAWRESARVSRRDTVDDSGRARSVTTVATTVLALAAAGVATWQSLLYGSPLVTDAAGRLTVNPLAVLAPALGLIAGALLVLLALGPLSRLAEATVARSRKLQPAYSVRQIARGLNSYAAAVLVIALGAGGVTVAAGYAATWQGLSERTARIVTGADLRASLDGATAASVAGTPLATFSDAPGVAFAARAMTLDVSVGGDAKLIALPADSLADLATEAGSGIDGDELATLLVRRVDAGIPLPSGTTSISVDVEYSAPRWPYPPDFPEELKQGRNDGWITLGSEVWVQDASAALVRIPLGTEKVPTNGAVTTVTYRVDLPEGIGPWTLEGFDTHTGPTRFGDVVVSFSSVRTHGENDSAGSPLAIDFPSWSVWFSDLFQFGFNPSGLETSADSITLRVSSEEGGGSARISPGGNGMGWFQPFADEPTIPIAIDERLAASLSVGVGDDIVLGARSYTIPGNIVALLPLVPGTDSPFGIIVDLATLNSEILRSVNPVPLPNELWVVTDGSAPLSQTEAVIRDLLGPDASISTVNDATQSAFPRPAELALWVAAATSLALALISIGAVTLTVARSRRGEVGVLRAVGVHAAAQGRARLTEVTVIVVTAIISGALVGAVTSALTVPGLARSVVVGVPEGLPTPIDFDWLTGGALLGLAGAAALVVALAYSMRVRAQALDTDERLETR